MLQIKQKNSQREMTQSVLNYLHCQDNKHRKNKSIEISIFKRKYSSVTEKESSYQKINDMASEE